MLACAVLATLLAWPFYEQMERFLFPALPVLVSFILAGVVVGSFMWALVTMVMSLAGADIGMIVHLSATISTTALATSSTSMFFMHARC